MRLRLAFIFCLAVAAAVPAQAGVVVPRVSLSGDPVLVRGFNFQARESVRVTLVAHARYSKRVSVSRSGAFSTTFPRASVEGCGVFTVAAIGSGGSRAYLKRQVGCPPAGAP
jgi:hypothetical protein